MFAMRLLTFAGDGAWHLGAMVNGRVLDLTRAAGTSSDARFITMEALLSGGTDAMRAAESVVREATPEMLVAPNQLRLGPPVPRPSKIVAVGLNYVAHADEFGFKVPADPVLFAKFPNSITGPYDEIVVPPGDPDVDYEAELAVVIGTRCRGVSADRALEYVAGYTVLNDVSARKWQFGDSQWTRGKSPDTFCPIGPVLVTRDEIPDPHHLPIRARVNGELRQDSNTGLLIHNVPKLIEYISEAITLEPGDIIATGTPPGVGAFRKPPVFLKDGDIVEVEVEGIGTLRNRVRC